MNKKVYLFLGGILLLIVVVVSFIFYVKSRNSAPPAADQTATNTTNSGTNSQQNGASNTGSGSDSTGSSTNTNQSGQQNGGSQQTNTTPVTVGGDSSGNTANAPQLITDSAAVSPVLSYDGKLLWYFTADGHLFNVNISTGLKQEYLLPTNMKVDNVLWPSIGNDFILESDSGSSKLFYYFSSQQKKFFNYPANVKEVAFLPDGSHVLYAWLNSDGTSELSTANFDLTGHKKIASLPDSDDIIKVAALRNRAFYYKNNAPSDGKLYYINLDTGKGFTIKTASDNSVVWSPDSNHFVYNRLGSDNDAKNVTLWLGDLDAKTDVQLNSVPASLQKISFDSTGRNIMFAVPTAGKDSFWVMPIKSTQAVQFYSGANTSINATNLFVSNDGNTLYYKNSDGYVYSLKISY